MLASLLLVFMLWLCLCNEFCRIVRPMLGVRPLFRLSLMVFGQTFGLHLIFDRLIFDVCAEPNLLWFCHIEVLVWCATAIRGQHI